MTVLFTAVSADWIVAAADSAITRDFGDFVEYDRERKMWVIPGAGVLSTWGARDGNQIGQLLRGRASGSTTETVTELARIANEYLTNEYCPRERGLGDVGYHIAGFLPGGVPALYHAYFEIPEDPSREPFYDFQDIQIPPGARQFLYNGRNDLAHALITLVLTQIQQGRATHFKVQSPADAAYLAHFIMRIAAEITPEVGPPFQLHVLMPTGASITKSYGSETIGVSEFERDFALADGAA